MLFVCFLLQWTLVFSQTIEHLNEISVNEELSIGSIVTFLSDKIPQLDQSIEYDLVSPLSSDLDLFSIDHHRNALIVKKRLDYETICRKSSCLLSISIAVSKRETIDVYILPIRLKNLNDNPLRFAVNRTVIEIDENDSEWSRRSYPLPRATDMDGNAINYTLYFLNWTRVDGLFQLDSFEHRLKALKQFDREEENLYVLRLVAAHDEEKDVSTDVIVVIKDRNDNPPVCEKNPSVFLIDHRLNQSIYLINATDLDQGENSRLEYRLVNPMSGFELDRFTGQLKFNANKWIRTDQSKLIVNVSDHGRPIALSSQCEIELRFPYLSQLNINWNSSDSIVHVEHLHSPLAQIEFIDRCSNCSIEFNSSVIDLFQFNQQTFQLTFNLDSLILLRILSNHSIAIEQLPLTLDVHLIGSTNSSFQSNVILQFHKDKIRHNSRLTFLTVDENSPIGTKIFIGNSSAKRIFFDATQTVEFDGNEHLIVKKSIDVDRLIVKSIDDSMEYRLIIVNPYSIFHVYPYFPRTFEILTMDDVVHWRLPSIPSEVNYHSNEILINEHNRTIEIPSHISSSIFDFRIDAINRRTPSLSTSIIVRLIRFENRFPPRLLTNSSETSIEAIDPDLPLLNSFPPTIEYSIEPTSNDVQIDRYTGRLLFHTRRSSSFNVTVVLTDFGGPTRLITREQIQLNVKHSSEHTFILLTAAVLTLILLSLIVVFVVCCCCCCSSNRKSSSTEPTAWKNISPASADTRLIGNEYITSSASLPRLINREQRVYPTLSYNLHLASNSSLDRIQLPPPVLYSAQAHLSLNDINKYLERFEKIYNNSSDQNIGDPVGSVV